MEALVAVVIDPVLKGYDVELDELFDANDMDFEACNVEVTKVVVTQGIDPTLPVVTVSVTMTSDAST